MVIPSFIFSVVINFPPIEINKLSMLLDFNFSSIFLSSFLLSSPRVQGFTKVFNFDFLSGGGGKEVADF